MNPFAALALLALVVAMPPALADDPPCARPVVDLTWCQPPTFGPYQVIVCGEPFYEFICMM